tara:strand:- start:10396 stop:12207 length:1812 start_codon:yes stop_codon:yes gene_type:complete
MASSPTTPSSAQQSLISQSAEDRQPAQPSFEDVRDMLDAARLEADDRYAHLNQLCEELKTQYFEGLDACEQRKSSPFELLKTRLRLERLVFDAYNKHRLGKAAWRFYKATPAPKNADEQQAPLGEDIDEDLESFPLRCEVVTSGFPWLTEDLQPIYQSIEHEFLPAAKASTPQKPKTGKASDNYDKLADAPPCNLDFPKGNMTLMELATFLPGSFKSWDVIDRACFNGASSASIATMINTSRSMDRGRITNNSVYRMLKAPMDKRAKQDPVWENWTTGSHDQYPRPPNFNPASVSVTGFRTPPNGKNTSSAESIPIKDLAKGVKTFPTGYDALDLTRAVRYCVDHPDEDWYYPDDYERLVNQLPQDAHFAGHPPGPAPVQVGHQDDAVNQRRMTGRMAASVRNARTRKHDARGRLMKKDSGEEDFDDNEMDTDSGDESSSDVDFEALDKKCMKRKRNPFGDPDSDSDEFQTPSRKPAKRKKIAPKSRAARKPLGKAPARPSRLCKELFADELDSDSDGYAGPNKKGKKQAPKVRRSGRNTKVAVTYNLDDVLPDIDEDDEDVPRPKPKKADIVAKYGMFADKSNEDETEEGEDQDEEDEQEEA